MIAGSRSQGVIGGPDGKNGIVAIWQSSSQKVGHQSRDSHDYQVGGHDVFQQSLDDENQNSGD